MWAMMQKFRMCSMVSLGPSGAGLDRPV
jgi:hypothetical protein